MVLTRGEVKKANKKTARGARIRFVDDPYFGFSFMCRSYLIYF